MSRKRKDRKGGDIKNSKARHRFNIGETFEAGIALQGTEVKTIREGRAQIGESFCRFSKNELFLYNTHIEEYAFGNFANHKPTRPRKLLLNRKELNKIRGALDMGRETCVPLRMYLKHGLVKVEIALCTGKKLFDKRQDLKKKTDMREAQRAMKHYNSR